MSVSRISMDRLFQLIGALAAVLALLFSLFTWLFKSPALEPRFPWRFLMAPVPIYVVIAVLAFGALTLFAARKRTRVDPASVQPPGPQPPALRVRRAMEGNEHVLHAALQRDDGTIWVAGQNLYHVMTDRRTKELVRCFLDRRPSNELQILLCDVACTECVNAWTRINPEHPGTRDTYRGHLTDSTTIASGLIKDLGNYGGRFQIKVTDLIPLEIMVVNPEGSDGYVCVVPVMNNGRIGGERPTFRVDASAFPWVIQYYSQLYRVTWHSPMARTL